MLLSRCVLAFFIEEPLDRGEIEKGVEHLSAAVNAVAVAGACERFLKVLEEALPPEVFRLLLERLPQFNQLHCKYKFIVNDD
jgi:hypothetical protein